MSIVFVLGAGASYGESLAKLDNYPDAPGGPTPTPAPVINGFFKQSLFESIRYNGADAEKDFPVAFEYIRKSRLIDESVGTGKWEGVDLEQVFTSIELERAFSNPESDRSARATLVRNQLVRFIQRILAMCTQYCYGKQYSELAKALRVDDSILTFNWDLLLDQALIEAKGTPGWMAYNNFSVVTKGTNIDSLGTPVLQGTPGKQGLYLKMHGSFNWYLCGNPRCPHNSDFSLDADTQRCLSRSMGIGSADCVSCGSEMLPLLVPPLLHKPISDQAIIRSIWGLARQRLEEASKVVVIGFSAPPTDFYAAWLLRSTVGVRNDVEVLVVNPTNDATSRGAAEFKTRMSELFPQGFDAQFKTFSQIAAILKHVYPK